MTAPTYHSSIYFIGAEAIMKERAPKRVLPEGLRIIEQSWRLVLGKLECCGMIRALQKKTLLQLAEPKILS